MKYLLTLILVCALLCGCAQAPMLTTSIPPGSAEIPPEAKLPGDVIGTPIPGGDGRKLFYSTGTELRVWDGAVHRRIRELSGNQNLTGVLLEGAVVQCESADTTFFYSASDGQLIYSGVCRDLTGAQRSEKSKAPAWRLMVPDEEFAFRDGLQGPCRENLCRDCGDFIIRRADGVYAYQLAVVCDDMAGGITQVVRGRDLLSSTPRQLYLYRLLGGTAPEFYHVPLLIDQSGRRLSKRDGDLDLSALLDAFTPAEIIGRLAWAAGVLDHCEAATPKELVGLFRWDRIQTQDIAIRDYLV
jgi:hypothetical protein